MPQQSLFAYPLLTKCGQGYTNTHILVHVDTIFSENVPVSVQLRHFGTILDSEQFLFTRRSVPGKGDARTEQHKHEIARFSAVLIKLHCLVYMHAYIFCLNINSCYSQSKRHSRRL
jgi:hypothetical protein